MVNNLLSTNPTSDKPANKLIRVHVYIQGYVQGVGFRFMIMQKAKELGVYGFIRHVPNSVNQLEAVFQGNKNYVEDMVAYCRTGPDSAKVDVIEVQSELPEEIDQEFVIM